MSLFEFFNITVDKEGHIEYVWECRVCGNIQLNPYGDEPPDECEYCKQTGEDQ